ncbi:GNS1/SUR4 membrane protein [Fistulina hepatica ATCC 64428]|uniref:Elongation of fatty acids protein n=1 Tax=Fistulina hepatica ATCC 64428 TaxID=1128425 RepID=A0A0D7APL5_9AGAR|nr:GNS1/SUR4 membrane protein [Fistulina hepatica ATCC 64428]
MFSLSDTLLAVLPFHLPRHYIQYIHGQTPLSTTPAVVSALTSYLGVIFGIQYAMKNQAPIRLNALFRIHNAILTTGSALLLTLMLEEIVPIIWKEGIYYAICHDDAWTPKLEFYYIINYFFKYLELFDTVFLALKKKPLQFLHVFHHSATALLCFTQLNGKTSISWTVISQNLAVHVVMYYYYYATAGGAKIWWKKYLTTMQIVQFIIDLFVVYFGTYNHTVHAYFPSVPHVGNCAGSEEAAAFGCILLSSYLLLFINFYVQTYKRKPARSVANGKANGVANGKASVVSLLPTYTMLTLVPQVVINQRFFRR